MKTSAPLIATTAAVVTAMLSGYAFAANAQNGTDASRIGQGATAWVENCGRCHNLRSPQEYSDASWDIIVQHMRVRANLLGSTADDIRAFLKASN